MGDFQANFSRRTDQDSGIHTVEGNVAGPRAAALEKKRQADQRDFEQRKKQIQSEFGNNKDARQNAIGSKFAGASATVTMSASAVAERTFQEATVGLVTAEAFRELKKAAIEGPSATSAAAAIQQQQELSQADQVAREKAAKKARKQRIKERKQRMATLSFAGDEEVEQDDDDYHAANGAVAVAVAAAVASAKKDPTIDTSFLPDKARDAERDAERQRLIEEWKIQQEQVKQERLEIVYSYWDGSGHRRTVTVKKGDTIETFLELVRRDLCAEFRELVNTGSDALVYVKEDLMLPHDLTFYDLIACKARGKSGPLFHFDVHDDVRVGVSIDVRVEKDESHPGKVVQRHWYERNKHIFPASRWEVYDPAKEYGTYTIGGKVVN